MLDDKALLLTQYATPGTAAHRALDLLVPEIAVPSESSAIRALVLAGHRVAAEERLRLGYERAVEAGEIYPEAVAGHAAAGRVAATLWAQE